MTQLFAALDPAGAIKFATEVPRGSACGCFCPVCSSPLVAKQGEKLEWHFAHEAGQERPDCLVGALNLLHRIGSEILREAGEIHLPAYHQIVQCQHLQQQVSWKASLEPRTLVWSNKLGRAAPVASGWLRVGIPSHVWVSIAHEQPVIDRSAGAHVLVSFPFPTASDWRQRQSLRNFIVSHLSIKWLHHPDTFGEVERAQKALLTQIQAEKTAMQRAAGTRWALRAKQLQNAQRQPLLPTATQRGPEIHSSRPADIVYPWAPERKPNSSFTFYRLKDNTAWVIYTRQDASVGLVPWPAFDGWDEYLPSNVGVVDQRAGLYWCKTPGLVSVFMSPRSALTRTSSNPEDFQGL
jgi:hypothetical protein